MRAEADDKVEQLQHIDGVAEFLIKKGNDQRADHIKMSIISFRKLRDEVLNRRIEVEEKIRKMFTERVSTNCSNIIWVITFSRSTTKCLK